MANLPRQHLLLHLPRRLLIRRRALVVVDRRMLHRCIDFFCQYGSVKSI
jgi:hypothetical protein